MDLYSQRMMTVSDPIDSICLWCSCRLAPAYRKGQKIIAYTLVADLIKYC